MTAASLTRARAFCMAAGLASIVLGSRAAASPTDPCRPPVPTVVCTVKVEELPAVLFGSGSYELVVGGHQRMPLPSTGLTHVTIEKPTIVRLDGPAYHGSISINPADCGEDAVHVIEAGPKPARLLFQAGDVPMSELIVDCVSGCAHELRPADAFPEIPFSPDETELVVELLFRARGYRSRPVEFKLTPGDNKIRVTLEKI